MEEAKLAILTDAKHEYSLQLVNVLKSSICNGIKFLYDESKKKCVAENRFNDVLVDFQEFLSQIRLWSQDMIEQEYKRIEKESECDFIKELITAVFMSHTQILQVIQAGHKKQTQIDIPKPEHFIHKCYINAGREFYKNPMFFYDGPEVSPIERHRNIPQSESVIATSINETIRQLLPVRRILKSYLQEQDEDEEEQQPKPEKEESKPKIEKEEHKVELTELEESKPKIEIEELTELTGLTGLEVEPKIEIEEPKSKQEESTELEEVEQKLESKIEIEELENKENSNELNLFEEIPDLSIDDIEEIISKQKYVIPTEKKDENENIKKNIISDLDFQEIQNNEIIEKENTIKNVEVDNEKQIKTKKQKQDESEIQIEKQLISLKEEEAAKKEKEELARKEREKEETIRKEREKEELARKEREKEETTRKEREKEELSRKEQNNELTIDTNFEFDEEIDLNSITDINDIVNDKIISKTPEIEPVFKQTLNKFKFFS